MWDTMHTTFPIISTCAIVSKVATGEGGDVIEPSIFRLVETQYLGPYKVEGIQESNSEHEDEKQKQNHARKELTLVA